MQKLKMMTIKVNNAVVFVYGKITKEKIEEPTVKYLKKVKIGDRGYFNKENGKEYCVAKMAKYSWRI